MQKTGPTDWKSVCVVHNEIPRTSYVLYGVPRPVLCTVYNSMYSATATGNTFRFHRPRIGITVSWCSAKLNYTLHKTGCTLARLCA